MLARLQMELEGDNLSYRCSSLLHGVLFEHIQSGYAAFLHDQSMHPYSQFFCVVEGKPVWIIQTLNEEAYQQIILPLLDARVQDFYIKGLKQSIHITAKKIETKRKKSLLDEFYEKEAKSTLSLEFLSATSFKQNGRYYILPDVRLLFQNLMDRYSSSSERVQMDDDGILEEISNQVFVTRFNIKSVIFPMEQTKIPGFMGRVSLRIQATETLKRYVRLLVEFGEFSGVGIKTAIGMGAMRLVREDFNG